NTFNGSGSYPLVYIGGAASHPASPSANVDFINNQFIGGKTVSPLLGHEAANSDLIGNTFSGGSDFAALEIWGDNTLISGNTITGGGAGAGILINASVAGTIIDASTGANEISGYGIGIDVKGEA